MYHENRQMGQKPQGLLVPVLDFLLLFSQCTSIIFFFYMQNTCFRLLPLGLLGPGAGRGRGMTPRGRGRGRGRGGILGAKSNVVDHRPKSLLVAGFSLDEKEEVLQHFMVSV